MSDKFLKLLKNIHSKNQRRWVLLFFCCSLWAFQAKAQVFPPDLQCVANDTLTWQLPNNNCGMFNAYQIWYSDSPDGPFQLLATIVNEIQTNFYHNNPTGETWYYYMTSDFNCPGEPVLTSDTLDNLPPQVAPIRYVSVTGSDVEINWQPSSSPEVAFYIIYRATPSGVVPIGTVAAPGTTYLDTGADPEQKSELYYVIATDACGNSSIFGQPHSTVFLDDVVDGCERTITLNWNLYKNWPGGIQSQELWLSVNGNAPALLEDLPAQDSSYVYTDTNDGDSYCFYVKATQAGAGAMSFSNEHCLDLDIVEPVRELFIKNITVNAANEVELTWLWNNDAEIKTVNVHGNYNDNGQDFIESFQPVYPLSAENFRALDNFDPSRNKITFYLETIDDCDLAFSSNTGSTIFLSGSPNEDLTNTLTWTDFELEGAEVLSYDVYRVSGSVETYLETVNANTTTAIDEVDVMDESEFEVCYFVEASSIVQLPDSSEEAIRSRSNTICVEQLSQIISPNAFAPDGINKEFKPLIVFGETAEYLMVIYDRWGQKIFETRSQDEGWTGKEGLRLYPSGVYAYYIRVRQANGRVVEDKGTVVLLR